MALGWNYFNCKLVWFPARWPRVDLPPCLEHSIIQNVHQTNARVRKCTCRPGRRNRDLDVSGADGSVPSNDFACTTCSHVRSRSTPVDKKACSICSNVLSLDARRSKCVFYMLKCALARRSSIELRLLYAQMCSRSTLADLNAPIVGKVYLGLDIA